MILEAKNILYSYKSKRDKNVLNNVSATFEESTFYAIVGCQWFRKNHIFITFGRIGQSGIRKYSL